MLGHTRNVHLKAVLLIVAIKNTLYEQKNRKMLSARAHNSLRLKKKYINKQIIFYLSHLLSFTVLSESDC